MELTTEQYKQQLADLDRAKNILKKAQFMEKKAKSSSSDGMSWLEDSVVSCEDLLPKVLKQKLSMSQTTVQTKLSASEAVLSIMEDSAKRRLEEAYKQLIIMEHRIGSVLDEAPTAV